MEFSLKQLLFCMVHEEPNRLIISGRVYCSQKCRFLKEMKIFTNPSITFVTLKICNYIFWPPTLNFDRVRDSYSQFLCLPFQGPEFGVIIVEKSSFCCKLVGLPMPCKCPPTPDPPRTVGEMKHFCAFLKKIYFQTFWKILRTFQKIGFLIRLHPRVLCVITKTLFLPWEAQLSTEIAKILNFLVFCKYLHFLENRFFNQTLSQGTLCYDKNPIFALGTTIVHSIS